MKHTTFNEPRPETTEELDEVLSDSGFTPDEVEALIQHDPWDPEGGDDKGINMTGYTAEITYTQGEGEAVCTTNGFEKREDLVAILEASGIEAINDA